MTIASVLLKSYDKALESGIVDDVKNNYDKPTLLPIYHSNKRSTGKDIYEILLNNKGEIVGLDLLEENKYIIFPTTIDSIARSGKDAKSMPLCDALSYIYPMKSNEKKIETYQKELNEWINFENNPKIKEFLNIILDTIKSKKYIDWICEDQTGSKDYTLDDDLNLFYKEVSNKGVKDKKTNIKKVWITFKIYDFDNGKDCSVNNYKALHESFINFQNYLNSKQEQKYCNLTGKKSYCITKHRGIVGNAKLISVSYNEIFKGRFDDGEQIVSISYEASSKIHNMIKYLMENKTTARSLSFQKGKAATPAKLCVWFSDDIENEAGIDITDVSSTIDKKEFNAFDDDIWENENSYEIGGEVTEKIVKAIKGHGKVFMPTEYVYLLMVDKVNDGRVAIKYFKELPQDIFFKNIIKWYDQMSWYFYNDKEKIFERTSPNISAIVDRLYGVEQGEKHYIKIADSKNKYKEKMMSDLIPSIIEGKKIPQGLAKQAFYDVKNRQRYSLNAWRSLMNTALAVLNKYKQENKNERMDRNLKPKEEQSRSYLYGRILAVLENLENYAMRDVYKITNSNPRITNAEKLWNRYTKAPASTLNLIKNKIMPYQERLIKSGKVGTKIKYEKIIEECINQISDIESLNNINKNKSLDEDFIFGYYAQKQDLYKKNEKLKEAEENNKGE
ncbi:MAG: type I-C CRISPR-associated protein Cas8c/Csd1 [Tissierellia bacterium]|nr:type I-C CRISPR-associated protein Cas8c/Csd1 [Tissierellia bacterium]